jgi:hydrophobic/amphiphilic exporter-1 (mainly G- bacteria), HAE1 family
MNQGSGKTIQDMAEVMRAVISKANQQPEISYTYSTFQPNFPTVYIDINRKKARKLGVSIPDTLETLQAYLGASYVNNFNRFGKVYQVLVQAEPKFRKRVNSIKNLYVKNIKGEMVPLGTLVTLKFTSSPDILNHYNMFTSVQINGNSAEGYSSGDAIKAMERVAKEVIPDGFSYAWTGDAYQQILAGNKAVFIFIAAFIFIYLFLIALYESFMIPFAVMFSIPVILLGAFTATWLAGYDSNIYTQIGFVLLLGLACKMAILIIEFAKKEHESGATIFDAAFKASKLRFRAVVMTSVAFIVGVIPLVFASGAGANGNHSIGMTVFGGMIFLLILGPLLVPGFFSIIQKTIDLKKKK